MGQLNNLAPLNLDQTITMPHISNGMSQSQSYQQPGFYDDISGRSQPAAIPSPVRYEQEEAKDDEKQPQIEDAQTLEQLLPFLKGLGIDQVKLALQAHFKQDPQNQPLPQSPQISITIKPSSPSSPSLQPSHSKPILPTIPSQGVASGWAHQSSPMRSLTSPRGDAHDGIVQLSNSGDIVSDVSHDNKPNRLHTPRPDRKPPSFPQSNSSNQPSIIHREEEKVQDQWDKDEIFHIGSLDDNDSESDDEQQEIGNYSSVDTSHYPNNQVNQPQIHSTSEETEIGQIHFHPNNQSQRLHPRPTLTLLENSITEEADDEEVGAKLMDLNDNNDNARITVQEVELMVNQIIQQVGSWNVTTHGGSGQGDNNQSSGYSHGNNHNNTNGHQNSNGNNNGNSGGSGNGYSGSGGTGDNGGGGDRNRDNNKDDKYGDEAKDEEDSDDDKEEENKPKMNPNAQSFKPRNSAKLDTIREEDVSNNGQYIALQMEMKQKSIEWQRKYNELQSENNALKSQLNTLKSNKRRNSKSKGGARPSITRSDLPQWIKNFDPHSLCRAKNNINISKDMTTKIIPNRVFEAPYIDNIYYYLDRITAISQWDVQNIANKRYKVINYDFHDKDSKETVYCLLERKGVNSNKEKDKKVNWQMIDNLFTETELSQIYQIATFPKAPRYIDQHYNSKHKKVFGFEDHYQEMVTRFMVDDGKKNTLIDNTKWAKLPIKCDRKSDNTDQLYSQRRMQLSLDVKLLRKRLKAIDITKNDESKDDDTAMIPKLVPILMFNNQKNNGTFWIEYIWIVRVDQETETDIGISLAYIDNKVKVKGIHLKKQWMMNQHQLVNTRHNTECRCFDDFHSNITALHIGNPDDHINKMNDLKKRHADEIAKLQQKLDAYELETKLKASQSQSHSKHTMTSSPDPDSSHIYSASNGQTTPSLSKSQSYNTSLSVTSSQQSLPGLFQSQQMQNQSQPQPQSQQINLYNNNNGYQQMHNHQVYSPNPNQNQYLNNWAHLNGARINVSADQYQVYFPTNNQTVLIPRKF